MMSLRARLILALVLLLAAAVAIADVAAVTALRSQLTSQLDDQLQAARTPLVRQIGSIPQMPRSGTSNTYGNDGSPPPDDAGPVGFSDFYVEIREADGIVRTRVPSILRDSGDPVPDITVEMIEEHAGDGPFTIGAYGDSSFRYRVVVAVAADGSGSVTVAAPLETIDDTVQRLIWVEVVVTIIVLLILVAIGWWVIRADLRPLDNVADAATAIAGGDLTRRVERADTKTEVGRLGLAFNTMVSQIEASFAERQRSADRLRRFAADASHELRTPLTAVRGYAELYRQGAITEEDHLRRVMQRIESEATRMGMVVEDLLLLARMDQGRPLDRELVNLGALVDDAVSDARVIDSDRVISYEVSADDAVAGAGAGVSAAGAVAVEVMGDRGRLHQIITNLLSNTLVHTPAGTPVHVDVHVEGSSAVLTVRDEGPGMAPDVVERVFERFYRADTGRSRQTGGAGLGLSIVQALVESHDGAVEVASEQGVGTTFTVRLPLAGPSEAVPAHSSDTDTDTDTD